MRLRSLLLTLIACLSLCGGPALAAISAPVSMGTTGQNSSVSASLALTTTQTANIGDVIVVAVNSASGQAVTAITDANGGTYTAAGSSSSPANDSTRMYYRVVSGSALTAQAAGITVTWAASVGAKVLSAVKITGLSASPLESSGGNSTGSPGTSASVATGTLSQADEIVLGAIYISGGQTDSFTQGAGFTQVNSTGIGTNTFRMAYQIVAATTAVTYNPTWLTNARDFNVVYQAHKGAGGAPATSPGRCLLLGVC